MECWIDGLNLLSGAPVQEELRKSSEAGARQPRFSAYVMIDKGKMRAEDFREAFAKRQREDGSLFKWVHSDYFIDGQQRRYGVTWSCERSGTWFLNLMEGKFDLNLASCPSVRDPR